MDNKGERVHDLAVEHDVELDQLALDVVLQLVVKRRVAARAGFERIEEVVDDLSQRQDIVQVDAVGVNVLHVHKGAAPVLTQLHDVAHIVLGRVDMRVGDRLLSHRDQRGVGVVGWVVDHLDGAVGAGDAVDYARRGGNQVEQIFSFEPFLDYFHVEQAEKAAPEAGPSATEVSASNESAASFSLQNFSGCRNLEVAVLCAVNG